MVVPMRAMRRGRIEEEGDSSGHPNEGNISITTMFVRTCRTFNV